MCEVISVLFDYKDKQFLTYNLFCNELKNNMLSHAYLIDDNDSGDALGIVKGFIKAILCENNHSELEECYCNNCRLIDNNNYPEVKVIKPDGMYIKKGQLKELQQEFSRSAVYGKKRIYVIYECEKMRTEAANSILKFLEEPSEDIIAFLITNNFNNVLTTIVSRCQIIKLNNNSEKKIQNEYVDFCYLFVKELENIGIGCIIKEKEIWFNKIDAKDRENIVLALDNIVTMYYDILKLVVDKENKINFEEYRKEFGQLALRNGIDGLIYKIKCFLDAKDSVKFNVNSSLLVDSIILKVGGYNERSRC